MSRLIGRTTRKILPNVIMKSILTKTAIILFWLIMTGWLVRYEAFPEKFAGPLGGYGSLMRHGPLILDSWMQIESHDLPVGYSHTWVDTSLEYGESVSMVKNQTFLNFKIMGQDQTVGIGVDAVLDAEYRLQKFSAAMFSGLYSTRIEGRRGGKGMFDIILKTQAAESRFAMEIPDDVVLYSPMLEMAMQRMRIGEQMRVRTIDPLSLTLADVMVEAVRREKIKLEDKTVEATLLKVSYQGMDVSIWIDDDGRAIREETPFGLTMRASTPQQILSRKRKSYEGADLFASVIVPVRGALPDPRRSKRLRLRLNGPLQELAEISSQRQLIKERGGNSLVMEFIAQNSPTNIIPLGAPVPAEPAKYLAPSIAIQSDNEQILKLAREVTAGKTDSYQAAVSINEWVHRNIAKQPAVSLPSALDVLQQREGDCNEHTYLYVALARAAGLPARINIGLVYADSPSRPSFAHRSGLREGGSAMAERGASNQPGSFYYHAWPSVYVGQWIEMDPTFGTPLVDAAYIRLLSGEIADQLKLLGILGRISVDILEHD